MTNDWKRMNDLGRHELVVRFCLFPFFFYWRDVRAA
jgi:hypothetical protein